MIPREAPGRRWPSIPGPRRWAAGALAALGLVAAGCAMAPAVVAGTGGIVADARAMPYFTTLRIGGAYDVRVIAGSTPDVTLYADASLVPYIETSITKDTLSIGTRRGTALRPSRPPRLDVFTWQLTDLTAGGVGTLEATKISGDAFTARFTGAGRATLSGAVRHLTIEVTGTADIDARGLPAEIVDVAISGVGEVAVAARDQLTVDISGTGQVRYAGQPRAIIQHITGSGEVLPTE